jgi:hypothetical protein
MRLQWPTKPYCLIVCSRPFFDAHGRGCVETHGCVTLGIYRGGVSMAGFIEGIDRGQTVLFPDRLEDWIGEDNLVRVVDLFVD